MGSAGRAMPPTASRQPRLHAAKVRCIESAPARGTDGRGGVAPPYLGVVGQSITSTWIVVPFGSWIRLSLILSLRGTSSLGGVGCWLGLFLLSDDGPFTRIG